MKAKQPEILHFSNYVRLDKPHISNSYLSVLKKALLNIEQQGPKKQHLIFGVQHHVRALEPHVEHTKLEVDDDLCDTMALAFRNDSRVKDILSYSKTEVQYDVMYRGVHVQCRLDVDAPDHWYDLKGTSAETESAFIKSIREFDYMRQAVLYRDCVGTPGTFIGQCKSDPEKLFFVPMTDHPKMVAESEQELHLLIDLHKSLRQLYEG